MPADRLDAKPLAAEAHHALKRAAGVSAATMLTVYIILLMAVPSYTTISFLGSLGRPAQLWGLLLLLWWVLARLQARAQETLLIVQPLRYAFFALVVVALLSFAAAMLRGQPADQISPAVTALLRLASWGGVLLVAMDGIRTHADVAKLVRRLAIAGAAMAALGLAQFITGQTLLEWIASIPGLTVDVSVVDTRGAFTRASGTAIHPLEYGTAVVAALPLTITAAVYHGFGNPLRRTTLRWWVCVGLILVASVIAVSRSAIIGLGVALLATLPAIPKAFRWLIGIGGAMIAVAVFAIVPGMFGTLVTLFAGASDDPSTLSRTNAIARVPEFLSTSPWVGDGFGTFLPRYYIFDNGWLLLLVELGVIGVLSFAAIAVTAMGSGVWAGRRSPFPETKAMGRALAAALLTISALFLFFDGLSFPISSGLFFLLAGLSAAMRTVAATDIDLVAAMARAARPENETSASGIHSAAKVARDE